MIISLGRVTLASQPVMSGTDTHARHECLGWCDTSQPVMRVTVTTIWVA